MLEYIVQKQALVRRMYMDGAELPKKDYIAECFFVD